MFGGGVFLRRRPVYWGIASLVLVALAVSMAVADYLDERELAAAPGQPESARR